MQVTIASIHTGPKLSFVQTTDGQKFIVWPDKLGQMGLNGGATFEVETQPWKDKTLITKATPVAAASTSSPILANGAPSASRLTPEQIWVGARVDTFVLAGKVNNKEEYWTAYKWSKGLWDHTYGPSGQLAANTALSRPTASQRALIERDVRRQTPASGAFFASQAGAIDELPEHSAA